MAETVKSTTKKEKDKDKSTKTGLAEWVGVTAAATGHFALASLCYLQNT